jgi:putative ABC transport system substrate-binding protein
VKRRTFIAGLGSAAAWSVVARGQEPERMRKIGALLNFPSEDPEGQARVSAFAQRLEKLGWIEATNVHTETRWGADDADRYRRDSEELVALAPDVILAAASPSVAALQRVTRRIPIVFANVIDPVGAGFVNSLARPGGNTTGFTSFEYSIAGKWLELLKDIAPNVTRAAVIREPSIAAGIGQFAAIQTMASASSTVVELSVIDPRDPREAERAFEAFAKEPNGGLIVTGSSSAVIQRDLIISLASRLRLPAVYPFRIYATNGGLAAYGPDAIDIYSRAATYVDRILKGEKPSNLPVQAPSKYELVLNLRTAKSLGLTFPPSILARADEVIE